MKQINILAVLAVGIAGALALTDAITGSEALAFIAGLVIPARTVAAATGEDLDPNG